MLVLNYVIKMVLLNLLTKIRTRLITILIIINTTIVKLNNRNIDIKYKFQNQKLSTLAMEFLKNEFSNLPLSNMNESGDYIFSCDYIRNCQFNGWFSEPESKDLNAYI